VALHQLRWLTVMRLQSGQSARRNALQPARDFGLGCNAARLGCNARVGAPDVVGVGLIFGPAQLWQIWVAGPRLAVLVRAQS
jgi:hypothetical protein